MSDDGDEFRDDSFTRKLVDWSERLRDLSANQTEFAKNVHDTARGAEMKKISLEMNSLVSKSDLSLVAVKDFLFSRPMPFPVGDAAVVDDKRRILLIRRSDNNCWAMPGGALETCETPAQGVEREAFEETGIKCKAYKLVGVFDSRFCGTIHSNHLLQFVFLCKPVGVQDCSPTHPEESIDMGWFSFDNLPQPLDPGHVLRIPKVLEVLNGCEPFFDRSLI